MWRGASVPDIFLSYNREDQAKAKVIAEALKKEGFDVWWDTVLRAGQTYDEVTEGQLHAAKAVVVLWSSRSVRSKWVRAEATLGDRKSALIPVMIEQCDRPIMFELIQTADLIGWEGDTTAPGWLALIADVRDHIERKTAASKPAAPGAVAPALAPKAEAPGGAPASDSIEAAFWISIADGDDREEFESYLERYPKGHFAGLAKKRLAALDAPKAAPVAPAAVVPPLEPLKIPKPPAAEVAARPVTPRPDAFQSKPTPSATPAARKARSPLPLVAGLAGVGLVIAAAVFVLPGVLGGGGAGQSPAEPVPSVAASALPVEAPEPVPTAVAEPLAVAPASAASAATPATSPAKTFRDCEACPEMMRLEGGAFTMGSSPQEAGHRAWEGPQREVRVAPFAIGLREVSFAEWEACVAGGGCGNYAPADKGWGRGARPVIMVSWNDAQAYVKWLSSKTGKTYRLPTEAEWEYAARGGTATAYWWGDRYETGRAPRGKTEETGSGEPNGFGLYNVTGNAAEWVQDCYVNTFASAPTDGAAVTGGGGCQRVLRGGGWKADAADLRIANRSRLGAATRDTAIGFRVVAAE